MASLGMISLVYGLLLNNLNLRWNVSDRLIMGAYPSACKSKRLSCGVKIKMAQMSNKPLKQNPFITMRDPETGRWLVLNNPDTIDDVLQSESVSTNSVSVMQHNVPVLG